MTDILTKLKTLLTNSWNNANTGSRTPTIEKIFDVKRIGLQNDYILLQEVLRRPEDACTGAISKKTRTLVVIDFRTMYSRDQLILMQDEIERILNSNQVDVYSDGTYQINDIEDIQDFSDQSVKLWRKTMDVRFQQFNETIS